MNLSSNSKNWLSSLGLALATFSIGTTAIGQNTDAVIQVEDKTINIQGISTQKAPLPMRDRCGGGVIEYNWGQTTTTPEIIEKPKLGVFLDNEKDGAVLTSVVPKSAAEIAGLQAGDKILKINTQETESIESLQNVIASHKIGDQITIVYERNGQVISTNATLQKNFQKQYNREHAFMWGDKEERTPEDASKYACEKLTEYQGKPFLGVYYQDAEGTGVRLSSIINNTGADKAKLKAEDIVLKMDGKDTPRDEDFVAYIRSKKPGDKVRIQLTRNGRKMVVAATIGSWAENPSYATAIAKWEKDCNKTAPEEPVKENNQPTREEAPSITTNALEKSSSMEVFPNPTPDVVTVKFEGKKAPLQITVVSIDGKEMFSQTIKDFNGVYNDQLDFSKYTAGVYFVHLRQNEELVTQQVIVE